MIPWRRTSRDFRRDLRDGVTRVGVALRDPEAFALRLRREPSAYGWTVWAALAVTASLGTMLYGVTMGLRFGAAEMFERGALLTVAAGLAWVFTLPTLYVLNSLSGSRLTAAQTLLAVLVTVSWGGLAMLASIPINWFFTAALEELPNTVNVSFWVLVVNLTVFAGVGLAMSDVFARVLSTLEPERGQTAAWSLALVAVLGTELFWTFGLFQYHLPT